MLAEGEASGFWYLVTGILRAFSNFVSRMDRDFNRFGDLLFEFGDTPNIETIFFESQFLSSSRLRWLLSGARGPPFEK